MFVDTLMRHCIKKDHDFLNVFEPFWKISGAVLHSTGNPCQRKTFISCFSILQLRERNFIEKTRRKWWDERSQCPKPSMSKTGNTKSLEVDNMAGVFLVLIGGFVTALLLLIIEIRCKKLVVYFTSGQVIC